MVRALRALDAAANRPGILAALERAEALATEGGVRAALPQIAEERGQLAQALGDDAEAARLLRAAQQLFTEVGAVGHAARLARGGRAQRRP